MAYTIELTDVNIQWLINILNAAIEKSKFRASLVETQARHKRVIVVRPVRLREAKPYCGQHPGPCEVSIVPRPKKKTTYLEWDDWVEFHNLINDLLDKYHVTADVWSTPFDARGKFWIRKGDARRVLWDWHENEMGQRVWNPGTSDQFLTPEDERREARMLADEWAIARER